MLYEPDSNLIVFFQNNFVPLAEAKLSILTHALHYGTGVFEGIRGYWNPGESELYLVRPEDHFARWRANCGLLYIDLAISPHELTDLTIDLIHRNRFETNLYIRPLAYRSAARIGIHPDDRYDFALIAIPYEGYMDSARGIRAAVSTWRRVEDNAIPGRGKICGAYVNSVLAGEEARRNGFDEAIFLTESGHVAEGASCNIFAVRHGKLITPPASDNILEGITRECVIDLARRNLNVEVQERSIDRSELYLADEVFFTGTAVEVAPVVEIDHRLVGHGHVGRMTEELRRLYRDATHGRLRDYCHWLTQVYKPVRGGVPA